MNEKIKELLEKINISEYTTIQNTILIGKTEEYYIYAIPEKTLIPKHSIIFSKEPLSKFVPIKLKKMDLPENLNRLYLKEILNLTLPEKKISKKEKLEQILNDFNNEKPFIFLAETPITEEIKNDILKLDEKEFKELTELIITSGYEIDKTLLEFSKPYFIRFYNYEKNLSSLQKFMPNAIICSSSKAGKTHIFKRLGKVYDRISISSLMGSYYSEFGMIQGLADENTTPIILDDIQEEKRKGVIQQSLNLIETGEGVVGLGKGTQTNMCCPLIVLRNPEPSGTNIEEKMLNSFLDTLEKLGNNPEALGSRFILLFKITEHAKNTENTLPSTENQKLIILHQILLKDISNNKLKNLFNKFEYWLTETFDDNYCSIIEKLCEESLDNKFKNFWLSSLKSYRHQRGWAFLKSIYDNLYDIIHNNLDETKFIKSCDKNLELLQSINITSLNLMLTSSPTTHKEIFFKHTNRLSSKSQRIVIYLIMKYYKENKKPTFNIDELRNTFNELPDETKKIFFKFYKLKTRIKFYEEIMKPLGITIKNDTITINENYFSWLKNDEITLTNSFQLLSKELELSKELKIKLDEIIKQKGVFLTEEELKKFLTDEEIKHLWENGHIFKSNNIWEIITN